MNKLNKLELKWIGKLEKTNIEPRVLISDKNKSIQPEDSDNLLIKGDNLISLHSIKKKFENKVKCTSNPEIASPHAHIANDTHQNIQNAHIQGTW